MIYKFITFGFRFNIFILGLFILGWGWVGARSVICVIECINGHSVYNEVWGLVPPDSDTVG